MSSLGAPGRAKLEASLAGQPEVVKALRAAAAKPVHAYLFVGPPGAGKMAAALSFAAMLLCPAEGEDACDTCRRAQEGLHPDLTVFERVGGFITIGQAQEVARLAARSSVEGGRSVIVLPELHLAREAVPALLKTIEEPTPGTVFIVLADHVPPEMATVASRCARVDFRSLSSRDIRSVLVGEGVPEDRAALVANWAAGRLDRARLLAHDPEASARHQAWQEVPARLDGTGATVAVLVDELVGLLDRSAAPLVDRHAAEALELAERNDRLASSSGGRSPRGGGRGVAKELEDRHRRELRRHRTDELRAGLAALAGAYRDRMAQGSLSPLKAAAAVSLIDGMATDMEFYPGEVLALQALFLRLGHAAAR